MFDFDQIEQLSPRGDDYVEPVAVDVVSISGQRVAALRLSPHETIRSVKQHLQDICAVPMFVQKLVLGTTLVDDYDTLERLCKCIDDDGSRAPQLKMTFVVVPHNSDMDAPLLDATRQGDRVDVEEILRASADPNHATTEHKTALYLAADLGHLEIVRTLCTFGANKDKVTLTGATPLLVAAQQGHQDIVRYLCEARAAPNKATATGATALFVAAREGYLEIVRLLCASGADKDWTMRTGATPADVARKKGHREIVHFFTDAGTDRGGDRHDNLAASRILQKMTVNVASRYHCGQRLGAFKGIPLLSRVNA